MISDKMREEVCSFYKASKLALYAVADATYKVNQAQWPLFTMAVAAKHQSNGLWRATVLPMAFAWVPNDHNEAVIHAVVKMLLGWLRVS